MFSKASFVALFASIATAQLHAAVGEPTGNPILRPLNEIVPACKTFTIVWQPTTTNTISLLLLKGPSTNIIPIQTLAEGINNSGSFSWTPASSLEATTTANGYGLQLIDDVTGQYQYSTQFGISDADCAVVISSSSATHAATSTAASSAAASSSPAGYSVVSMAADYPVAPSSAAGYPVASSSVVKSSPVAPYPTTVKTVAASSAYVASTGAPVYNSSIIQPTGSMTIPSSLRPSATGAGNGTSSAMLPESTGAAGSLKAGLSLVGAAALAALML